MKTFLRDGMEVSIVSMEEPALDSLVYDIECDGLRRRITVGLTETDADPVGALNSEISDHVARARRAQQHRTAVQNFVEQL